MDETTITEAAQAARYAPGQSPQEIAAVMIQARMIVADSRKLLNAIEYHVKHNPAECLPHFQKALEECPEAHPEETAA